MMSDNYWIVAASPNNRDEVKDFLEKGVWMTNKHLDGSPTASVAKELLLDIKVGDVLVVKEHTGKSDEVSLRAVGHVKEVEGHQVNARIREEDDYGLWYKAKVDWKEVNGGDGEVIDVGFPRGTIYRLEPGKENHKPLIDFVEKWLKENP